MVVPHVLDGNVRSKLEASVCILHVFLGHDAPWSRFTRQQHDRAGCFTQDCIYVNTDHICCAIIFGMMSQHVRIELTCRCCPERVHADVYVLGQI